MSSNPAPTIAPGDRVNNLLLEKTREVIEEKSDAFIVRKDEAAGNRSPLWTWLKQNCVLASKAFQVDDSVTVAEGERVGKVVAKRVHKGNGIKQFNVSYDDSLPSDNWVASFALHHAAPVADKMKATEPAAEPLNLDDMPKPAGADDDALFRAAKALADEQLLRKDAEARAEVAEKNNKKLLEQVNRLESTVTKPVAAPQTCWEIKIVKLQVGMPESEKKWQDLLAEGWKENHISSVIDSRDAVWQIVTFKKLVEFDPQPTRGIAGHHAALTSPFQSPADYRASQEQPAIVADEIILEPVNQKDDDDSIFLSTYRQLFKAGFTVDEVIAASDRRVHAVALASHRARMESVTAFNRPLLSEKVGS